MELLDTDVCIDLQRGPLPAVAWFESLSELPSTSGFVAMELLQAAKDKSQLEISKRFSDSLGLYWPTRKDCQTGLRLFEQFHLSHGLGLIDSLIAATALGKNATLLTFNTKHFRPIPGLKTAEPYTR